MAQSTVKHPVEDVVDLSEEASIRVLHVDDEAGFLKAAKQILEMQGAFEVDTASSVEEAMEIMKEKTFDVVVSDYIMPGKDGLQFLKELRDCGNNISFIMFTGKGREEVAIRALNLGADRYFNKIGSPEVVYGELAHGIRRSVEMKKAEEALLESEKKYRNIVELSPDSIMTVDTKGVITSCNTAAAKKYGYSKDEIIGRNFTELGTVNVKDVPQYMKLFGSVLRGEVTKPLELTFYRKDGTPLYSEIHVSLLKQGDKITGIISASRDITERKRVEETLSHERDLIQTLLEHYPDFIYFKDSKARFHRVSKRFCDFFGRSKEDIIGKTDLELFPKEVAEQTYSEDIHVIKTGTPLINKEENAAGTWVLTTKMPWVDKDGNIIGLFGISRDVTERKKAEKTLLESEKRYRFLFEQSPIGVGISALDGTPITVNDALKNILGYSWKELQKIKAAELYVDPKQRKELLETIRRQGCAKNFTAQLKRKDGTTFDALLNMSQIKIEDETLLQTTCQDITKRKRAEEQLKESEERYRVLVESAADAIFTVNEAGEFLSANQEAAKVLGKTPEDMIGKNMYDMFSKDIADQQMKNVKAVFQTGKPLLALEDLTQTKFGQRWYSTTLMPVRDNNGKIVYAMGIARDVTERKKTEGMLTKSGLKYKGLVETSGAGIATTDLKGRFTFVNKALCRMIGYSEKELLGRPFVDFLYPKDKKKILRIFWNAFIRPKKTVNIEFRVVHKNGHIVHMESTPTVTLHKKKIIGFNAIMNNITERKKADEELRSSEERLKILFESAPDAIYINDLKGNFVDGNKAAEELTGYNRNELIGKSFLKLKLLSRKQVLKAAKLLAKNAFGKPTGPDEFVLNRKDDTQITVEIRTFPVKIKGQTLVLGIARDITERKKTLEKLKTLNEKLDVVGKLTRHDARNKLSTVTMNAYMAKEKLKGNHEALEHLSEIESAAGQVEGIFEFARIYEKIGAEDLTYMDVERSLGEAVMLFSDLHGVEVVNDCSGLTVLADSLLRQLLYNLIDNSLKHGKTVSQIRVYYEEAGKDKVKLVYEDDGVGIRKAEKDKIFNEGYGKGSGYGLYLIRKMCEVYGWTIRETGKQGKRVQFTITIPKMDERGRTSYRLH